MSKMFVNGKILIIVSFAFHFYLYNVSRKNKLTQKKPLRPERL